MLLGEVPCPCYLWPVWMRGKPRAFAVQRAGALCSIEASGPLPAKYPKRRVREIGGAALAETVMPEPVLEMRKAPRVSPRGLAEKFELFLACLAKKLLERGAVYLSVMGINPPTTTLAPENQSHRAVSRNMNPELAICRPVTWASLGGRLVSFQREQHTVFPKVYRFALTFVVHCHAFRLFNFFMWRHRPVPLGP